MAKDKDEDKDKEKKKKKTGFLSGLDIINENKKIISISPAYDLNMGGGLQEGTWNIISGPPGCGKTTKIAHIISKVQQAKPNAEVYWGDVENRLTKRNLQVKGIDLERIHVIRSTKDKYMYAEDYLAEFEEIIRTKEDCVLVVDSISALCTQDIDQADYTQNVMTTKSNILVARFIKKCIPIVAVNNIIFIGVNQMMANPSGYGAAMKEKGVTALAFQADNKIICKKTELIENAGKTVGQSVQWKIEKSCLSGAETNSIFENVIYYGRGIHEELELLRMAVSFGVVKKKASWYEYIENAEEEIVHKWQGEQTTLEALEANPELMNKIKEEVDRTIN